MAHKNEPNYKQKCESNSNECESHIDGKVHKADLREGHFCKIEQNPFKHKFIRKFKTWQVKVTLSMNKTDRITWNFGHSTELLCKFKMG